MQILRDEARKVPVMRDFGFGDATKFPTFGIWDKVVSDRKLTVSRPLQTPPRPGASASQQD